MFFLKRPKFAQLLNTTENIIPDRRSPKELLVQF